MFAAITFVIRYLPLVIAAVTFVQNFADQTLPGETRKAMAVDFIVDSLAKLGVEVNTRTLTIIEWLIDMAVRVLNRFGIFASSSGGDLAIGVSPAAEETVIPDMVDEEEEATDARLAELEEIFTRR